MTKLLVALLGATLWFVCPASAQQQHGFNPCTVAAGAQSMSVTTTTSNVQLTTCGPNLLVFNITSQEAFYAIGKTSSTTATTGSFSIPGNSYIMLSVPSGTAYWFAAITGSSTTTLRLSQGIAQ